MRHLQNTFKVLQYLLYFSFFIYNANVCNAQTIEESKPTVESINQKIGIIHSKIESLDFRINQLQTMADPSQDIYIANLKAAKTDLSKELDRLERVKVSVIYAEQNNLLEEKQNCQSSQHVYTPAKKVKITQADFDALPESKKQAILAVPDQYEITN